MKKKSGLKRTANVRSIGRNGGHMSPRDNGLQVSLRIGKQFHALIMSASSEGGLLVSRAAIASAYLCLFIRRENGDAWSRESAPQSIVI